MQFTYQARDLSGQIRSGEVAATTADEATRQLRQEGFYLLSLDEGSKPASSTASLSLFQKRISRSEIIYLTNQLAVMIDAGVPLANALNGLSRQTHPTLKRTLGKIQQDVEGGEPLSQALARFPKYFDKTYVNLVKASEASGTLGSMLDRIAVQMRSELETRQKVRGALMYPAAMLVMCVAVCIFLLTYVFPKIVPMFATRSIEIPTPTLIMMYLSDAMIHQWYWFVAGSMALLGFVLYARKQWWGRLVLDWVWIHIPILGPMLRKVAISRSLRTLATTINAGVPVLEAIELSAGVSNNIFYERCWNHVGDQVVSGRQIHESLEGNRLFPQTLLQMIASGESTGKLGQVLNKVSDYYDREVATSVKSATSLIEPIMVAAMGGVIGVIALAMLLPIFRLSSHVG